MSLEIIIAGGEGAELTGAAAAFLPDAKVIVRRLTIQDVELADLVISAGHTHFISAAVRQIPRLGAVGLHPSLLPLYRGSYPLWWALRNREHEVGLSLYYLVDHIDAGPIIDQRRVPVFRGDTFTTLYARVTEQVPIVLASLLDYIALNDALPPGTQQDEAAATVVRTPARWKRALMRARWAIH